MALALREAILQSLSCMLSSSLDIRKLAEERMKALEVTDEYTDLLLEIVLTTDEALEERQLAAIILKQFIKDHWANGDLFDDIIIPEDAKNKLKFVLPMGLSDSQPKIRTAVAVMLSHIAEHDYPERWSNMVDMIRPKLLTNNSDEVDGVVTFVDLCTRTLPFENLYLLTKEFYEVFYNILDTELFSPSNRTQVVKAASHLLLVEDGEAMMTVSEYRVDLAHRFFMLVCRQLRTCRQHSVELKSMMVKVIEQLLRKYATYIQDSLSLLLPTIWELLSSCGNEYRYLVMSQRNAVNTIENEEDKLHFDQLINNIFSLVSTIVETKVLPHTFGDYLPELLYWIMLFQSIIPTFERDWEDEYNFLNDDSEDQVCNSIRTTLRSLLNDILHNVDCEEMKESIVYAVNKHMAEAELYKDQNYVYWWRILESIMFSLGNISWIIKKKHQNCFETITQYLTNWSHILDTQEPMILQARIVWVGGHYSAQLTISCFIKHIDMITRNITSSHHILRISAIRALSFHCLNIERKSFVYDLFTNASEELFQRLLSLSERSNSVFGACVDSIRFFIKINPHCATRHSSRLTQFITEHVMKHLNDAYTVEKSLEVIKDLSNNHFIVATLQQTLLHIFLNILMNLNIKSEETELRCLALRIVDFLVMYSPKHLVEDLVRQSFPVVYRSITTTKEPTVLEYGITCMQTFLAKATDHVCRLRDIDGQTGVDCIQMILKQVLSPLEVELTSLLVAKFIIFALRAIHRYRENVLDMTIKGLISKIHIISVMKYEDSLVLVFAYLFYTNLEYSCMILSTIPGPEGGSALQYIFVTWLKKHHCFFGKFEKNLSTVALSKIMEYALSRNDERLVSITITNDIIPQPSSDLILVSSEPNAGSESEPLFVKIFRLLVKIAVHEIQVRQEESLAGQDETVDEIMEAITEPENDLEYIYKIDIIEYILNLLRPFSETHHYQSVLNYMKLEDKNDISSLGLNVQG